MTTIQKIKKTELLSFTPRQIQAHLAVKNSKYLLYGGAMGGGKSRFIRWELLSLLLDWAAQGHEQVEVGLFCENYPALEDRQLSKIGKEFPEWLGTYHGHHALHGRCFILDNSYGGGIIKFRNLDDASKYQSAEFAAIGVDELTKNTEDVFDDLRNRLRWPGIAQTKFIAATNPGDIGHAWVKKRWLDRDFDDNEREAEQFIYIPAKATDNPHIAAEYLKTLESLPEDKRKAFLEGDWDIFKGQFFSEWRRALHVIEPFQIPNEWKKFVCGDYGFSAPSAALWCAISPDDVIYIYRELYQTGLTYKELTKTIVSLTPDNEQIDYWVFDPAIWAKDGKSEVGLSGADIMEQTYSQLMKDTNSKKLLRLIRGNNERVTGWNSIRERLRPKLMPDETTAAGIQAFSTCTSLIRTLPSLVYDDVRIEDCDTDGEDHAPDALRYGVMSNPTRTKTREEVSRSNFNRLMRQKRSKGLVPDYGRRQYPS